MYPRTTPTNLQSAASEPEKSKNNQRRFLTEVLEILLDERTFRCKARWAGTHEIRTRSMTAMGVPPLLTTKSPRRRQTIAFPLSKCGRANMTIKLCQHGCSGIDAILCLSTSVNRREIPALVCAPNETVLLNKFPQRQAQ